MRETLLPNRKPCRSKDSNYTWTRLELCQLHVTDNKALRALPRADSRGRLSLHVSTLFLVGFLGGVGDLVYIHGERLLQDHLHGRALVEIEVVRIEEQEE
jgi:hypothetical protein